MRNKKVGWSKRIKSAKTKFEKMNTEFPLITKRGLVLSERLMTSKPRKKNR